jgi:hypothetical protein
VVGVLARLVWIKAGELAGVSSRAIDSNGMQIRARNGEGEPFIPSFS